MVSFQIVSDLHIETLDYVPNALSLIKPSADVLILAGDIGRIHKIEQLKSFLIDVCKHFQYVLYVPGNHEYYREKGYVDKNMRTLLNDLKSATIDIKNLRILDCNSVTIDDVCVIGCTLWSNATSDVPRYIVRVYGMNKERYNNIHKQNLMYIEHMIKYCKKNNLKPLVVTHHCPTKTVIKGTKKELDRYVSLYVSDLDYLLEINKVNTWVCGHLHINFDVKTNGGTRLVSNQKGKPRDNITDYSKNKVIQI